MHILRGPPGMFLVGQQAPEGNPQATKRLVVIVKVL